MAPDDGVGLWKVPIAHSQVSFRSLSELQLDLDRGFHVQGDAAPVQVDDDCGLSLLFVEVGDQGAPLFQVDDSHELTLLSIVVGVWGATLVQADDGRGLSLLLIVVGDRGFPTLCDGQPCQQNLTARDDGAAPALSSSNSHSPFLHACVAIEPLLAPLLLAFLLHVLLQVVQLSQQDHPRLFVTYSGRNEISVRTKHNSSSVMARVLRAS